MPSDVMFDANVLSLYLFLWRHWEMISDLLFKRFLPGSSNISSFSVSIGYIIQLNRSIVHDIKHFICERNNFKVYIYILYIYVYIYIYNYILEFILRYCQVTIDFEVLRFEISLDIDINKYAYIFIYIYIYIYMYVLYIYIYLYIYL